MKREDLELLAPAGSIESLKAAVNAGADAVYIGGSRFGARAYAENPEEDALLEGIRYAHRYGCRVHLTVNTLLKDKELSELDSYIEPYYEAGLDAVIVQDLGVFAHLAERFPLLPLHASTQMTVTGPESALFLKSMGAARVIPARELSLPEIRTIAEETGMEVECFVHGALCYGYSGQCLMSSLIGGRSGNRGRCAQPCRLPYTLYRGTQEISGKKKNHLLSCKDLCALDVLPDLIEAGVISFKIEGRMKSPRYTAGVVSIYRKYIDLYLAKGKKGYRVDDRDRKLLLDLFDRGGQTAGYYRQHNGPEMLALFEKPEFREGNEELNRFLDTEYVNAVPDIPAEGSAFFSKDAPMCLSVSAEVRGRLYAASAFGPVPESAKNRGAEADEIRKRLMKTGGSGFTFTELGIEAEEGLFLPVGQLNALRRDALSALEEEILGASKRAKLSASANAEGADESTAAENSFREAADDRKADPTKRLSIHATCETKEQILAAAASSACGEVSFTADAVPPEEWAETAEAIRQRGKKACLCLPQIFRIKAKNYIKRAEKQLIDASFDAVIVRAVEEIGTLKKLYAAHGTECPPLYFDFQVYGFNRNAAKVLYKAGADRLTLPVELNRSELRQLGTEGKELVVYGRLPMMVSAQCLKKTTEGCSGKPEVLWLRDRKGMLMPVRNHCAFCTNTILNASPMSLLNAGEEILKMSLSSVRLLFTTESGSETAELLAAAENVFFRGKSADDAGRGFTRGHYKRGVE